MAILLENTPKLPCRPQICPPHPILFSALKITAYEYYTLPRWRGKLSRTQNDTRTSFDNTLNVCACTCLRTILICCKSHRSSSSNIPHLHYSLLFNFHAPAHAFCGCLTCSRPHKTVSFSPTTSSLLHQLPHHLFTYRLPLPL